MVERELGDVRTLEAHKERGRLEDAGIARKYVCTLCDERPDFETPEEFGSHLECHSPVGTPELTAGGKPRTRECAKGCGRHFRGQNRQQHETICDGMVPLPEGKRKETWPDPEPEIAEKPQAKPVQPRHPCPCPKCGSVPTKLAFDGYGTNWRCARGSCGYEYREVGGRAIAEYAGPTLPKPPAALVDSPKPKEEKPMATVSNGPLVCRKGCGKEFTFDVWRMRHEEGCQGAAKKRASGGARRTANRSGSSGDGNFTDVIDRLKAKRQRLIDAFVEESPEIKAIDEVIAKLEVIG